MALFPFERPQTQASLRDHPQAKEPTPNKNRKQEETHLKRDSDPLTFHRQTTCSEAFSQRSSRTSRILGGFRIEW